MRVHGHRHFLFILALRFLGVPVGQIPPVPRVELPDHHSWRPKEVKRRDFSRLSLLLNGRCIHLSIDMVGLVGVLRGHHPVLLLHI